MTPPYKHITSAQARKAVHILGESFGLTACEPAVVAAVHRDAHSLAPMTLTLAPIIGCCRAWRARVDDGLCGGRDAYRGVVVRFGSELGL